MVLRSVFAPAKTSKGYYGQVKRVACLLPTCLLPTCLPAYLYLPILLPLQIGATPTTGPITMDEGRDLYLPIYLPAYLPTYLTPLQ